MVRLKRITTRGWLGKALNVLTFGYYPANEEEDITTPADWCVSDAVLHMWTAVSAQLHNWTVVDAATHDWAASDAPVYAWVANDTQARTWTVGDETAECD